MSREVVVRAGTGPLHIRTPGNPEAICGHKLPAKVITWPRGEPSIAIWKVWRHCLRCEHLERVLRR